MLAGGDVYADRRAGDSGCAGRVHHGITREGRLVKRMERETGIEPATNGLGSRDSTTELLPLDVFLTVNVTTTCLYSYLALERPE